MLPSSYSRILYRELALDSLVALVVVIVDLFIDVLGRAIIDVLVHQLRLLDSSHDCRPAMDYRSRIH